MSKQNDLSIEQWPIDKVIPYTRNARKIPQSAIDKVAASIKEFGRSSFSVRHRVTKAGAPAVEGHEKRVWTVRDPNDKNRLRSGPIPAAVLAGFKRA